MHNTGKQSEDRSGTADDKNIPVGKFCKLNRKPTGIFLSGPEKQVVRLLCIKKAETEGFEPSCPEGQPDFESGALRPLRYVSIKLTRLLL